MRFRKQFNLYIYPFSPKLWANYILNGHTVYSTRTVQRRFMKYLYFKEDAYTYVQIGINKSRCGEQIQFFIVTYRRRVTSLTFLFNLVHNIDCVELLSKTYYVIPRFESRRERLQISDPHSNTLFKPLHTCTGHVMVDTVNLICSTFNSNSDPVSIMKDYLISALIYFTSL